MSPPQYLDLATWPRREAFAHFLPFDQPQFDLCTRIDVAPLKAAVKARGVGSFSLAYHFIALRLANELQPFRYRLRGGADGAAAAVEVVPEVHASATVMRADESFGFAYFRHQRRWSAFAAQAQAAMAAVAEGRQAFDADPGGDAVAFFTTIPWVHFSSFQHARRSGVADSVPRFSFGRADADGERLWLPLSVSVHHALMDGLHVGRFVQAFEAAAAAPEAWLAD